MRIYKNGSRYSVIVFEVPLIYGTAGEMQKGNFESMFLNPNEYQKEVTNPTECSTFQFQSQKITSLVKSQKKIFLKDT